MGIVKKMVHEVAAEKRGNVHWWPGTETLETADEEKQPKRPHWFFRAAVWTGVIMSDPETPKGWSFNPSTITLGLVIASLIAGGSYYLGAQAEREKQIMERLRIAEHDAAEAKKFSVYAAAGSDAQTGHKPEPKKEPAK